MDLLEQQFLNKHISSSISAVPTLKLFKDSNSRNTLTFPALQPFNTQGGGSFQSAMTLSNVAGIFYILISGLGVSMVVSLLEFLSKTCQDARKNKVGLGVLDVYIFNESFEILFVICFFNLLTYSVNNPSYRATCEHFADFFQRSNSAR